MTDSDGDLRGARGRSANAGRDVMGGAALLLDRSRDRARDAADALDGLCDRLDGGHRLLGRKLHARDLGRNLVGCLGGLASKRLDLLGHHCEAAPRIARARGLDGRVQGEEIGLLGNRRDQLDDVADTRTGFGELSDALVGGLGLLHRLGGDRAGFLHLRVISEID